MIAKYLRYVFPEFQILHFSLRLLTGSLKNMPARQEFGEGTPVDKEVPTVNAKPRDRQNKGRVIDT